MLYKILFYSILALYLVIALISLSVHRKGGYTNIVPTEGFGFLMMKTKVDMYDDQNDHYFISNKITLALGFVFVIFEWEEDNPNPGNGDQELKMEPDGN